MLGIRQPHRVLDHARAAAVVADAGAVRHIFLAQHDHRRILFDGFRRGIHVVDHVGDVVAVAVRLTARAPRPVLAAADRDIGPRPAVGPHAVRVVAADRAIVTADRVRPDRFADRAEQRHHQRHRHFPVQHDRAVRRHRADDGSWRQHHVDVAECTRGERAQRIKRQLEGDEHRGLRVQRAGVDAGARLARGAAEIDLDMLAALGDLRAHDILFVIPRAVAVDAVLGFVHAVRQLVERVAHRLGAGVDAVAHRAEVGIDAVARNALLDQPLAELQLAENRHDVRIQQRREARVVEQQAEGRAHGQVIRVQQHRAEHETILVDIRLRAAEATRYHAAHVELVGAHVEESDQSIAGEHRPDEAQIVDVRADAVGIVADQHVAGFQVLRPVLFDGVAHGVRHRADEHHQARADGRHRVVEIRRAGHGDREVVPVADDRRERVEHEPRAHVLHGIAQPVAEHGGGEAIAMVGVAERLFVEIAQAVATAAAGRRR